MRQSIRPVQVSECWDSSAFVMFFAFLGTFVEQCIALYYGAVRSLSSLYGAVVPCIGANRIRSRAIAPAVTVPASVVRVGLGEDDLVIPTYASRPLAPVSCDFNRDGYDMASIPAIKAVRKPRIVKATSKPRKGKLAAQAATVETPAYIAPDYASMSDADLLAACKQAKVKGASARWKRETMLAKLAAL